MIRWVIVRLAALGMRRRRVSADEMRGALAHAFPWEEPEWREDVLLDALACNRRKLMRRINA